MGILLGQNKMPKFGKIYYYSPVPRDLLKLIGEFAGDINRPILFSLTPKKKYLGPIFVVSPYKKYRLTEDSWVPKRLGEVSDAARIQQYMFDKLRHTMFFLGDHDELNDLKIIMKRFLRDLTEVRNYNLK